MNRTKHAWCVQDFFGGITIFTREQFEKVNGFGMNFWGWGREDDNMRQRLMLQGMFPPELPAVPTRTRHFYFEHQRHQKALEVLLLYMAYDFSNMSQMRICFPLGPMVDIK